MVQLVGEKLLTAEEIFLNLPTIASPSCDVSWMQIFELGGFVAGGAIRDMHTASPIKDYDVFCQNEENFNKIEKLLTSVAYNSKATARGNSKLFEISPQTRPLTPFAIDLVSRVYGSVEDVLSTFDCSLSRAAIFLNKDSGELEVFYGDGFEYGIQRNTAIFNEDVLDSPVNLERFARMLRKGFAVDSGQLYAAFDNMCRRCGCKVMASEKRGHGGLVASMILSGFDLAVESFSHGFIRYAYFIHDRAHDDELHDENTFTNPRDYFGANYLSTSPLDAFDQRSMGIINDIYESFGGEAAYQLTLALLRGSEAVDGSELFYYLIQRFATEAQKGLDLDFYIPMLQDSLPLKDEDESSLSVSWGTWMNFLDSGLTSENINGLFLSQMFGST